MSSQPKMDATAELERKTKHNKDLERRLKSILRTIVTRGYSVDRKDDEGQTVLHLVAQYWVEDRAQGVPELRTIDSIDHAFYQPLNYANSLAIARFFLENEAEVDPSDRLGRTPLYIAVQYDNIEMVSLLLHHKANVNTKDEDDWTPLYVAGSQQSAELLLANGALVNATDKSGRTPLHSAVGSDRLTLIPTLLKYGASVRSTDENLRTPLHFANSRQMADLLLKNGAISDARDKWGMSPLHVASACGSCGVMRALLEFGATVNAVDRNGGTALHQVVESGSTGGTIKLLIEFGVDINAMNINNQTAIQKAIISAKEEEVLALLEENVEVFPRSVRHRNVRGEVYSVPASDMRKIMEGLPLSESSVNVTDSLGGTTLQQVVECGPRRYTIKVLLKPGIIAEGDSISIQNAIASLRYQDIYTLLESNVVVYRETAPYQSISIISEDEERSIRIGRLIDASLKLRAAGLSPTRDKLRAFAHNSSQDYFYISLSTDFGRPVHGYKTFHFGARKNELERNCISEVERMKNHMLTTTMSVHDFMLTDGLHCVFTIVSKSLLDALRGADFGTYPTYENFLTSKFRRLDLMVSAKESFSALLGSGKTNASNLPDELVVKILVHLDNADLENLISCSISVIQGICKDKT